ncbi:hypothetical protein HMPREF0291_10679 [Corynebacterium genitalium ATCC 33030]|uniref:Uncharacterized protein n=1 Tax=Corynebacterium genitalium ATCC 33030 TaxID=585529 RepID=D7W9E1_9CORY|nr:hypothetical protein [Corynebacterium sp. CCUG 65737]EFK55421.1 hypothetical protein HMPREF0291_10679 [Corynebacterium genitalium ATCC 33030]
MTTNYLSPKSGRKVIARTNTGEEIYLIEAPASGEVVREAWKQTGTSMKRAMKRHQSQTKR